MSDKALLLAEEISDKASYLAVWRSFVDHPGWKLFHDLLEEQKNSRKGEILFKPLKDSEALYAQEFMKGEISGLTLAQVGPFALIEGLKADVQVSEAKLEQENERESQSTDGRNASRVDGPSFSE